MVGRISPFTLDIVDVFDLCAKLRSLSESLYNQII